LKRPNYNAAKRARELKQKAKRDSKLARRHFRAGAPASQPDASPPDDPNGLNSVPAPTAYEQEHGPLAGRGT